MTINKVRKEIINQPTNAWIKIRPGPLFLPSHQSWKL